MVKEELIQRSPVRVFMDSIGGGLKPGELGVISAPSGIGKTSVLVQIGLDRLLQGGKIIHISFHKHTDYILTWYEDIFDEFIQRKNLENQDEVKGEVLKNRVIMKFTQGGITNEQIIRSLRALIKDGNFKADALIIDGYNFDSGPVKEMKSFAEEMGLCIWYSATTAEGDLFLDADSLFKAVITMEARPDHVALGLAGAKKGNEHLALKLDPRTLLLLET
ncbi:MAG: hypothetical protein FWH12_01015 [Treponema sp.]|nr:hypothetical protein [Treponema sp.]